MKPKVRSRYVATCEDQTSFLSKMLMRQLVVFCLALSWPVIGSELATGCGCSMEKVVSNNTKRIPARISELICRKTGEPCGPHDFSKVRSGCLIHTRAKIHILSKNLHFPNHNLHKIHIFRTQFFTKITFFSNV